MIFYRKDLEEQVNQSVFPGLQGGPHNHTISGIAVALKMAATIEFKDYQHQIVANCRALADRSACNLSSVSDLLQCHCDVGIHMCVCTIRTSEAVERTKSACDYVFGWHLLSLRRLLQLIAYN